MKTPKRVKSALDLLDKMIRRHGRCSYKALRNITCPSKVKRPEHEAPLDSSIILVRPFTRFWSQLSLDRLAGALVRGIDSHVLSASFGFSRSITGILPLRRRCFEKQAKVCRICMFPYRGKLTSIKSLSNKYVNGVELGIPFCCFGYKGSRPEAFLGR